MGNLFSSGNATVTGGLAMGQPTEDDEIEFVAKNFDQLPNGHVLRNTFSFNGGSWKLDTWKSACRHDLVDVIVRLELINKSSLKTVTARIECEEDPDELRYNEEFDDADDFMLAMFTFKADLPVKNLKLQIQLEELQDDDDDDVVSPMSKWFKDEQFGDTTIVAADGKKFRCHRDILARRSEVFRLMFNCPMKESNENVVNIEDFDGDVVAQLLLYIYTDDCQVDEIADRLYPAAHKYQLDLLKTKCESALDDNLSAETIVKTYRLATFYRLAELKATCVDYLNDHKSEMSMANLLVDSFKLEGRNEGQQEKK